MENYSFLKEKMRPFVKSELVSKLYGVDFILAKDELAKFIRFMIEQGKKRGKAPYAKREIVSALDRFNENPCLETAISLLGVAPAFLKIFEQCKPTGGGTGLAITMSNFAHYCADSLIPEIEQNVKNQIEKNKIYIKVYSEFYCFIVHWVNRLIFGMANQDLRERFLKSGWLFACIAVDSIIGNWPEESKLSLSDEILAKLDKAEIEYSESKALTWDKDRPQDSIFGDSLLAKLTRNIAMQCGYEMVNCQGVRITRNLADIMILQVKVSDLFIDIMKEFNFESIAKFVS
jgi:hypothetical protein